MKLIKEIEGVFKKPVKKYYCGRIKNYAPYFEPWGFSSYILRVRKLIPLTEEQLAENKERGWGWAKEKWQNMPMVRRSKDWVPKIFGNHYWVQLGRPWAISKSELGWKDKYNSPRYEWPPFFHIWFFKWQFCITWKAPEVEGVDHHNISDKYWEMVLWYLYYADKDIKKAEETWPWVEGRTKKSTWNKNYLV